MSFSPSSPPSEENPLIAQLVLQAIHLQLPLLYQKIQEITFLIQEFEEKTWKEQSPFIVELQQDILKNLREALKEQCQPPPLPTLPQTLPPSAPPHPSSALLNKGAEDPSATPITATVSNKIIRNQRNANPLALKQKSESFLLIKGNEKTSTTVENEEQEQEEEEEEGGGEEEEEGEMEGGENDGCNIEDVDIEHLYPKEEGEDEEEVEFGYGGNDEDGDQQVEPSFESDNNNNNKSNKAMLQSKSGEFIPTLSSSSSSSIKHNPINNYGRSASSSQMMKSNSQQDDSHQQQQQQQQLLVKKDSNQKLEENSFYNPFFFNRKKSPFFKCPLCQNEKCLIDGSIEMQNCSHRFCSSCFIHYLHEKIQKKEIKDDQLTCPFPPNSSCGFCPEKISTMMIQGLVTSEDWMKYQEYSTSQQLEYEIEFGLGMKCPNPLCKNVFFFDTMEQKRQILQNPLQGYPFYCDPQIQGCNHHFCIHCKAVPAGGDNVIGPAHPPYSCQDYKKILQENSTERFKYESWQRLYGDKVKNNQMK